MREAGGKVAVFFFYVALLRGQVMVAARGYGRAPTTQRVIEGSVRKESGRDIIVRPAEAVN